LYIKYCWPEGNFDDLDFEGADPGNVLAGQDVANLSYTLATWKGEVGVQDLDEYLDMLSSCVRAFCEILETFKWRAENENAPWCDRAAIYLKFLPVLEDMRHGLRRPETWQAFLLGYFADIYPDWYKRALNEKYLAYNTALIESDDELQDLRRGHNSFIMIEHQMRYVRCVVQAGSGNPYVCTL